MQPTEAPWGPGKPPFIIAEIGLTHEGSLGNALAFIDACADVGASAVKFQCHDGDDNGTFREGFKWPQDFTRQEYWRRTAFSFGEWLTLIQRARRRPISIGCTPFAFSALPICDQCDFIKISRQFAHSPLHTNAVKLKPDRVLFTGDDGLGLNQFDFERNIGISDHSATIAPSVDAFKRGAQVCELHVCWDRRQFGPDVAYSVTIDELAELVRAVR